MIHYKNINHNINRNRVLKPVFPKEKSDRNSKKVYFRFGKLKCKVIMKKRKGERGLYRNNCGMIFIK
jgi:3-hydroxyacyl-[acyl-carrier-protein] dehydratase